MILSEQIVGKKIIIRIQSSNLKEAVYDTETKEMVVTFNSNRKYSYEGVLWEQFTKFRMAESQGKYFNEHLKKLNYKEIKDEDISTAGTEN